MRLGIIIPYRKREDHLRVSAPILKRYGEVYVIEQMDSKPFNRGKLINVGYLNFNSYFDYFAAHDVDMIPLKANYAYSEAPCHIATQVEQFEYSKPYENYFGGVTLFPNAAFEKVNGFSNNMWGWGGEDDFIRKKFVEMGVPLQSRECLFSSLPHTRAISDDLRRKNVDILRSPIDWDDGLSNCWYSIAGCQKKNDYTLLQVMI